MTSEDVTLLHCCNFPACRQPAPARLSSPLGTEKDLQMPSEFFGAITGRAATKMLTFEIAPRRFCAGQSKPIQDVKVELTYVFSPLGRAQ